MSEVLGPRISHFGEQRGEHSIVSRPTRMAKERRPRGRSVLSHKDVSLERTIWPDEPDSARWRFDSVEYRRRTRARRIRALFESPVARARVSGRARYTVDHREPNRFFECCGIPSARTTRRRNRPNAARPIQRRFGVNVGRPRFEPIATRTSDLAPRTSSRR